MVNLFDLLKGTGSTIKNASNTLYNRIIQRDNNMAPQITPLQMTENGEIDKAASLALKNQTTPLTFGERMTGRTMTEDFQSIDPKTGEAKLETISSYRPGLLNDIVGGYKENRFTPASLSNFGQNELSGGRQKGFGYRLGEGLGSLARFGESPLGRSLLVGGIIGASGGSGIEALAYGGTAGMLNQANRNADRIYRDDLIQSQQNALRNSPEFNALSETDQNAQLQGIADNINAQRGYVNKDVYSNLINTQQIRDNADWRKMYFDTQQENNQVNREFQQRQLENSIAQANANRALQWAELGERRRQNDMSNTLAQQKILADMQKGGEDFGDMRQQLDNFAASFDTVDNPYRYRIAGKGSEFFNTLTEDEANFNAQRTLLFNQIARKLGGEKGVLSDNDIKRIEAALPTLADTKKQKEAKMKAVYALLNIKEGSAGELAAKSGNNDPLGIL